MKWCILSLSDGFPLGFFYGPRLGGLEGVLVRKCDGEAVG